MFTLTFLGTAASVPSVARGLPALLVAHDGRRFLVDCGEGTQRQLLVAGLGTRRIDTVLLTHGHLDHVLGLGGLAATFSEWGAARGLTIHGGRDALDEARRYLEGVVLPEAGRGLDLAFRRLAPGAIIDDDGVRVSAFAVEHRATESYGFLFEGEPRRHFDRDRAAALELPEGPARQRLAGGETVTLADGRRIVPDQVLGPLRPGTRLAVVGDTARVDTLVAAVAGVDALVIEATYRDADIAHARANGHITAREAAGLAVEARVGALYITHISNRYRGPEVEAEARAVFPDARVMNDFDHVIVSRQTPFIPGARE